MAATTPTDTAGPHPSSGEHFDDEGSRRSGDASTDNFAEPGDTSDPQERNRPGHDRQPQPPEAAPKPTPDIRVNTVDDVTGTPLAGKPVPEGDPRGATVDADERKFKPVLDVENNRTGGG